MGSLANLARKKYKFSDEIRYSSRKGFDIFYVNVIF